VLQDAYCHPCKEGRKWTPLDSIRIITDKESVMILLGRRKKRETESKEWK
jgi:hypothetical protein